MTVLINWAIDDLPEVFRVFPWSPLLGPLYLICWLALRGFSVAHKFDNAANGLLTLLRTSPLWVLCPE